MVVRIRVSVVAACIASLAFAGTANGQFIDRLMNPQVATAINHPPGLGVIVSKVAFGPSEGEGSDQFVDALTARFVAKGVEVVERARLQALMSEHKFALSGYVDQTTAARLGKIVGPAVMVFVDVQRHTTEKKGLFQDHKDYQNVVHRTYISRTQAFLKVAVRSVDLATGRIFAAKTLDATPLLENRVVDRCCPEFPSEYNLLDMAMRQVVEEASRMFLPWTSTAMLYYFDDKDCNLKSAFTLHKGGDVKGALRQSIQNVEACTQLAKPNAKALAHAYHNVGMGHFALNEFDKAVENLELANRTKTSSIHVEAATMVRVAADEQQEMQRVDERMAVATRQAAQTQAAAAAEEAAETLTNASVMTLVKAKLPTVVIVAKIKAGPTRFDTSAQALVTLKQNLVPDDVIVAMMSAKSGTR